VSSPGEGYGSTFRVELPVHRRKIAMRGVVEHKTSLERKVSEDLDAVCNCTPTAITITRCPSAITSESMRALVVDDAALNRKMLCNILKTRCGLIHEAADGHEAVERLREAMLHQKAYHVVLLDNQMPKKSGPVAAAEMRAMGYKGFIIGVTGCATPQEIKMFASHGADYVMQKPLDVNVLDKLFLGELEIFSGLNILSECHMCC